MFYFKNAQFPEIHLARCFSWKWVSLLVSLCYFFYHHFQFWIKWSVFKCLCLLNDALHLPSEFQVNHIQFECFCLWFLIHSYLAKHVHESVCIIKIHWNIKKNISFPIKLQADFFQHIDFIMNRKKTPGTRKVLENDREKFNV